MYRIKKGNYEILTFVCVDRNGDAIEDLADTEEVLYMIKENKTDDNGDALVSISMTASNITVDDPEEGSITVVIPAVDTEDIPAGEYYQGLQLVYPSDVIIEIWIKEGNKITDKIKIEGDVIRTEDT